QGKLRRSLARKDHTKTTRPKTRARHPEQHSHVYRHSHVRPDSPLPHKLRWQWREPVELCARRHVATPRTALSRLDASRLPWDKTAQPHPAVLLSEHPPDTIDPSRQVCPVFRLRYRRHETLDLPGASKTFRSTRDRRECAFCGIVRDVIRPHRGPLRCCDKRRARASQKLTRSAPCATASRVAPNGS